jgi:hypothetical protein
MSLEELNRANACEPASTNYRRKHVVNKKELSATDDVTARNLSNRRHMLIGGAVGGMGALVMSGVALAEKVETDELSGLWLTVISAADNSFPSFRAIELYGRGTYIGSGQPDLQPGSLSSSAWGIWEQTGARTFRLTARYWTYDTSANPTGFGAASTQITLSKDGNTYTSKGPLQFFDNNGKPVLPSPIPIQLTATRIKFS